MAKTAIDRRLEQLERAALPAPRPVVCWCNHRRNAGRLADGQEHLPDCPALAMRPSDTLLVLHYKQSDTEVLTYEE